MKHSIDNMLKSLTAEEKATLSTGKDFWTLHGVPRLNLPSIMLTDGPHGLRKQSGASDHIGINESVPATCFPSAVGLAASWNQQLLVQVGDALAKECLAEQVSVLLGPGVNIKRHPMGGRNFEYFSEDPYLTGTLSTAWVNGVQNLGIGASLKHFALNNHEEGRMVLDVVADERTVREIYLPGFEMCVKQAKPWTVMCAYNKFRGQYLSENEYLLKAVLRDEWGFNGVVVTDWGANHSRVDGIINGQSLEMPGGTDVSSKKILSSLERGELSMEQLDESVGPVVELMAKSADALDSRAVCNFDVHHELARTAAEESCVLLKNGQNVLPLNQNSRVLVVGALATETRYQGSGSSQIIPTRLEQPLDEIKKLAAAPVSYTEGYLISGEENSELCAEAITLASDVEKIIVVVGLTAAYESEGFDRSHMGLPANQISLIESLAEFHDRLVVVLQNGSPVEMPFRDSVAAIVEAYLGGQAGASALARILYGQANPSGKLAETFPVQLEDVPSNPWFPGEYRQSQYREGLYVGYRYFETAHKPVLFHFGHGLSYTSFEYADLEVSCADEAFSPNSEVTLAFTVTNTGDVSGAEISQIYLGQKNSSVPRPSKELKAYEKRHLEPNESSRIIIKLDFRAFAFWDKEMNDWVVESDDFEIMVGASVADIRLSKTLTLRTERAIAEPNSALAAYYEPNQLNFDDAAFTALLGHDIPEPISVKPFQMNSTLSEISSNWLGARLHRSALNQAEKMLGETAGESERAMTKAMLSGMPLRGLIMLSGGKMSEALVSRLIHAMNNRWLKVLLGGPVRSE